MAIPEKPPHFVMLPFLAQGHMIPMMDIARLLAKHGASVTVLTTPNNYNRFKPVIARAVASGLSIHVFQLKFPCVENGLPEGCDNFDRLPSVDHVFGFFKATVMLKDQVEVFLQEVKPKPSCLISDMCYSWTTRVAAKLHIPRIVFHVMSCFALVCLSIRGSSIEKALTSDTEYFVVPGLPDRIEITRSQLRGSARETPPDLEKVDEEMLEAEKEAFGTVVNSFQELEPEYVKLYSKIKGKKVWPIGPVSLCNNDELDKAERGNKASVDESHCLKWLDSQEPSSVLYVCLGSLPSLGTAQLAELGLGLEASNRPFIWVTRNASDELKQWLLEENFEERINKRGLLIHGWAPQVAILSHPSVGGFLTHCGWNSTLEAITAGMPMITWPLFAEQFCNEKFIVNVIKTGVRVGVEIPIAFGETEIVGVQVKSVDVKNVIDKFLDGGEEGRERRERARKLREMANRAVEEGGSSYLNVQKLIEDVILQQAENIGNQSDTKLADEIGYSSEIVVG